jgi:hypothetical protein
MPSSKHHPRQHIDAPASVDLQTAIDAWAPDWDAVCHLCGTMPCVTGLRDGQVVYRSHMCGICTFGEQDCADPQRW